MKGRIENELKIAKKIECILKDMPEFVTEWYYNMKASNIEETSCYNYINKLKNFLSYISADIKNIKTEDITLIYIEKYFIQIQKKTNKNGELIYTSNSYQYGIWCALNNFFTFMVRRKYIKENYISQISKPNNNDLEKINENRILLTKEDFNMIICSINKGVGSSKAVAHQNKYKSRDLSIMMLFMTTGIRREALSQINIEDINFEEKRLLIIDKGMKRHLYYLSDKVIESITDWICIRKTIGCSTDALFISGNGRRMTSSAIYKMVQKYCNDALGYNISPHKIRAGFCSILYNEKGDIEFVRRAVGHSNISTTQRYIVTKCNERAAASSFISDCLV